MKKFICMLLAVVMMFSLVACKGQTEPVATTPTVDQTVDTPTVENTDNETNQEDIPTDPSEEEPSTPSNAPEVLREPPTEFEAVNPAKLPQPVPVEEQLQSENTKTITLGSVEEYEDLLWSLGFTEVRLAGTHDINMREINKENGFPELVSASAYCEPVSLTYSEEAFRLDFVYCMTKSDGNTTKEDGWSMYGTKSVVPADVSKMTSPEYVRDVAVSGAVGSGDIFSVTIDGTQFGSEGEAVQSILDAIANSGNIQNVTGAPTQEESKNNLYYTEEFMSFGVIDDLTKKFYVKLAYYTITGNLYNYMRDPDSEGTPNMTMVLSTGGAYQGVTEEVDVGYAAKEMCFHYLFPEE